MWRTPSSARLRPPRRPRRRRRRVPSPRSGSAGVSSSVRTSSAFVDVGAPASARSEVVARPVDAPERPRPRPPRRPLRRLPVRGAPSPPSSDARRRGGAGRESPIWGLRPSASPSSGDRGWERSFSGRVVRARSAPRGDCGWDALASGCLSLDIESSETFLHHAPASARTRVSASSGVSREPSRSIHCSIRLTVPSPRAPGGPGTASTSAGRTLLGCVEISNPNMTPLDVVPATVRSRMTGRRPFSTLALGSLPDPCFHVGGVACGFGDPFDAIPTGFGTFNRAVRCSAASRYSRPTPPPRAKPAWRIRRS